MYNVYQLGICGDVIAKYIKGVFHNQLATSGHMTQGITPQLCFISIYNMFHMSEWVSEWVSEYESHIYIAWDIGHMWFY